jgi:hypothetical protein
MVESSPSHTYVRGGSTEIAIDITSHRFMIISVRKVRNLPCIEERKESE